jgi:Zn-dependent peptidase ImmA (M78 family)
MRDTDKYKYEPYKLLEDYELLKKVSDKDCSTDIEALIKKLNIELKQDVLEDNISGKIEYIKKDDSVTITIDESEIEPRQRFSLAHEVAHYIHDIDFNEEHDDVSDSIFFRSDNSNPIERQANKYAEQLLMPLELIDAKTDEIIKQQFPDKKILGIKRIYKIVSELSNIFKVSKPAIIMRLASISKINYQTKQDLFNYHMLGNGI